MKPFSPAEFRVVALRECAPAIGCTTPKQAFQFWRYNVTTAPWFDSEKECLVVLLLNTRLRIRGFNLVSVGSLDCVICHPREVFRVAIMNCASEIILMHNHPSGIPTPSDGDIEVTHELERAGKLLRIRVHDHIIVGGKRFYSMREKQRMLMQ